MKKKMGFMIFVVSVLIFFGTLLLTIPEVRGEAERRNSFSGNMGFDEIVKENSKEKQFELGKETEVWIKISSYFKEGSFDFTIESNDGKVWFEERGSGIGRIEKLVLPEGKYTVKSRFGPLRNGRISYLVTYEDSSAN